MAAGPTGRVLVTSADAAAVPDGVRVVAVGQFSLREAVSYLSERVAADPDKRHGAIELAQDLNFESVALTHASAVIANSPLSCREYRSHFLSWREHLAKPPSAPPPAAAVTWMLSFERADQLAPDGSARSLLALAALLDGHGIPESVFAAPAAGYFLAGGGDVPASIELARAALDKVGLVTVEQKTAPPVIRISPVLQAALRAAMPEGLRDQAATSAADALLQAWPERELPGWPASGLRSCVAALRRIAARPAAGRAAAVPCWCEREKSLDRAGVTGPRGGPLARPGHDQLPSAGPRTP